MTRAILADGSYSDMKRYSCAGFLEAHRMKTFCAILLFLSAHPTFAQQSVDAQDTEREAMAVLDAFMAAFNARDAAAEERTYHFPHYRLASGQMRVLDAAGAQTQAALNDTYRRFVESGWARSAWTRRKIVHLSADKVHIDTQFTRYRKDGSIIGAFDSLYIVTKENGRWGIKMRSSFAS
jgi:hypothetical protein